MKSKNLSLKQILTTASTLALIVGASSEASASVRNLGNVANITVENAGPTPAAYVDGTDGLRVINAAGTAITLGNDAVDIRGIDLTNRAGSSIIVGTANVALGAIRGVGVAAPVEVNAVTLTLNGSVTAVGAGQLITNDYSGLGTVTLSNNANSKVKIDTVGAAVFANDFGVHTDGIGRWSVAAGSAGSTFAGNIGTQALKFASIQVQGNATFTGANIASTVISLINNSTMTLDSTNNTIDVYGPINNLGGRGRDTGSLSTIGANNITFHNPIGVTQSLVNASFVGGGAATTLSFNGSINADTILHQAMTLDATAGNLTINTPAYATNNTTYDIGNQTITITGGQVTLLGDIVIKATYVNPAHVSLDLSTITPANLIERGVNTLTLEITGAPAADTPMILVSPLLGGGRISIPQNKIFLRNSGLWQPDVTKAGQLIYNPTPPVVQAQQAVAQALDSTGATSDDLAEATKIITTTFGGKGVVTNDGNTLGAAEGQKVLHIIDPTKFTADLSTAAGAEALLTSIPKEVRDGLLAYCEEQLNNNSDSIVFIPKNTAAAYAIIAKEEGSITPIMADAMIHQDEGGISQGLVQDIINVSREKDAHRAIEMSDRIIAAHNASFVTLDTISSRTAATHTHISTFAPVIRSDDLFAESEGIAAGSSAYDKFGIWGSINGGKATQKQRKGNDGFRSTSQAIVLGADTMINDKTSIGFAVSHSMNHMKHKNNSAGNKTDAVSWIGSLYGTRQLKNNWFVRGTALYNNTNINNKDRRVLVGGNYGIAQGKYKMISYGGEANIGFTHKLQKEIIITPTVGLRVLHTNKVSYAETGNTNQNHKNITQKAMNNYSALAGLSVAKTIVKNDIAFTPEAHANFQYGINMKAPSGSFVSPLTPLQNTSFVGTRASKLTSTYGLSLTGSNDRIECAVSADVNIAEKYVGYTGALKLKVKF